MGAEASLAPFLWLLLSWSSLRPKAVRCSLSFEVRGLGSGPCCECSCDVCLSVWYLHSTFLSASLFTKCGFVNGVYWDLIFVSLHFESSPYVLQPLQVGGHVCCRAVFCLLRVFFVPLFCPVFDSSGNLFCCFVLFGLWS